MVKPTNGRNVRHGSPCAFSALSNASHSLLVVSSRCSVCPFWLAPAPVQRRPSTPHPRATALGPCTSRFWRAPASVASGIGNAPPPSAHPRMRLPLACLSVCLVWFRLTALARPCAHGGRPFPFPRTHELAPYMCMCVCGLIWIRLSVFAHVCALGPHTRCDE